MLGLGLDIVSRAVAGIANLIPALAVRTRDASALRDRSGALILTRV